MTQTGIEAILKEKIFTDVVARSKASVFAQTSKMEGIKSTYFSERGKDAAQRLSGVTINHARTPGFIKAEEAAAIMEFATGKTNKEPDAFESVNRRSAILSSVAEAGAISGGRMKLVYTTPSGAEPLDQAGQSKMAIVTRFLNRSLSEYREAFTNLRNSQVVDREAAQYRLVAAEEDVIADSEVYLQARNDLATYGYDVSNFDKNAEQNNLFVLAIRRYELDKTRELAHQPASPNNAKPSASAMSLN